MSEPYSEEDLGAEVMQNWLKHFGLGFHQVHASGHCSRGEIEEIVKKIKPKQLFPVHTEHPEMFKGLAERVHERIELGEVYKI
jgi:ribonuclease J